MRYRSAALAALLLAAPAAAQEANPLNLWVLDLREPRPGEVAVGPPRPLTDNAWRNSQPSFTPDGRAVVFASQREGGQVDVYRVDLASGAETRLTDTPENENSPTMAEDGTLTALRWKPETLFTEFGPWRYDASGRPVGGILPGPDTVGYYARVDETTYALMRPATRFTVALHDLRTGRTTEVDGPAAPLPPQRIPGARAISFTRTDSAGRNVIRRVDVATGQASDVAPALPARTAHAWTPAGTLLMARGNRLYARRPGADADWREVAAFDHPRLRNATAYAVSPAGDRLVIYSTSTLPLHVLVRDLLVDGRGGGEVAAEMRRLEAAGALAEMEVQEGGLLAVVADWTAMGRAADAVEVGRAVVALRPASHGAQAALGGALRAAGDREGARAAYRRALELNPRADEGDRRAAEAVEKALRELEGAATVL